MDDWSFLNKYNQISPAAESLNEFGEKEKKKKETPFLNTISYPTTQPASIGGAGYFGKATQPIKPKYTATQWEQKIFQNGRMPKINEVITLFKLKIQEDFVNKTEHLTGEQGQPYLGSKFDARMNKLATMSGKIALPVALAMGAFSVVFGTESFADFAGSDNPAIRLLGKTGKQIGRLRIKASEIAKLSNEFSEAEKFFKKNNIAPLDKEAKRELILKLHPNQAGGKADSEIAKIFNYYETEEKVRALKGAVGTIVKTLSFLTNGRMALPYKALPASVQDAAENAKTFITEMRVVDPETKAIFPEPITKAEDLAKYINRFRGTSYNTNISKGQIRILENNMKKSAEIWNAKPITPQNSPPKITPETPKTTPEAEKPIPLAAPKTPEPSPAKDVNITLYRADTGMGAFPHVTYATGYPEIAKSYGAKVQKLDVNIPEDQVLHIDYKVPTKAAYDFHDVVVGDRKIDFQRISPEDKEYLLKKGYKAIDVTKVNLDGTKQKHYEVVLLDKNLIKNSTPIKTETQEVKPAENKGIIKDYINKEDVQQAVPDFKVSPSDGYTKVQKEFFVKALLDARDKILSQQDIGVSPETLPVFKLKDLKSLDKWERSKTENRELQAKGLVDEKGERTPVGQAIIHSAQERAMDTKEFIYVKVPNDGEFTIPNNINAITAWMDALKVQPVVKGQVKLRFHQVKDVDELNKLFISTADGKKPIPLDVKVSTFEYKGIKMFVVKLPEHDEYSVYEQRTGLNISYNKSRKKAIDQAIDQIKKVGVDEVQKSIDKALNKNTQPVATTQPKKKFKGQIVSPEKQTPPIPKAYETEKKLTIYHFSKEPNLDKDGIQIKHAGTYYGGKEGRIYFINPSANEDKIEPEFLKAGMNIYKTKVSAGKIFDMDKAGFKPSDAQLKKAGYEGFSFGDNVVLFHDVLPDKVGKANINPEDLKQITNKNFRSKLLTNMYFRNIPEKWKETNAKAIEYAEKNGGASFNLTTGENQIGRKGYVAVSFFPEETEHVPIEQLTAERLSEYEAEHSFLFSNPKVILGLWVDKPNGVVWVDVSAVLPKEQGIQLAKKYKQKAVFDLETLHDIPTGGTGKGKVDIPFDERLKEINKYAKEAATQQKVIGQLPPKEKLIQELGLNKGALNDRFYEAAKKMDLGKNLQAFDTRYTNLYLILSSKYFKPYLREDVIPLVNGDRSAYAMEEALYNKEMTTKDAINEVLKMWHEVKRIASLYKQSTAISVEDVKKLPVLKAGMAVSSKDVGKTYRVGSWIGKLVEFDNMYGIQAEYKIENGKLIEDVSWIPVYPKNKGNKPGYMSMDLGSDIIDSLKELFHPEKQSERDLAYSTLNAIRKLEIGENLAKRLAVKTRDSLLKRIGKPNKVFLKIVDDWLDQPDKFQELYDTLPEEYKELGILIKQTYKRLGEYAKENNILEELRDNYTMHIYKDNESLLAKQLFPSGGKLGTKFRYARARVYNTKEEAIAHGLHPIDNPILKVAIYTQQLFLTLNNKEFIQELLPSLLDKETRLPAVMRRPKSSNKEALSIYNNVYEELQNRNLSQWMWLKSEDDTNMMVKIPLKAHPKVAQIINSYTKPHLPPHGFVKYYLAIRALIKRSIFFNPLIHGVNIEGVRTAIWAATNPFIKRPRLNEQELNSVERYAINSGMVLGGYSKQIMYDLIKEMKPDQNIVTSLISDAMRMNDALLWDILVPHAQLSSFYRLTTMLKKSHPDWSKEKIGKYAADALNPFYGTMPDSWFPEIARNLGSVGFLAFKWTASNIDLIVKSLTFGKRGLGTGTMDNDEKRFIGRLNIAYFFASLFMLLIAVNVSQLGLEAARNKLIDLGVIKGDKVKLHTTFQNEIERNILNIFSVDSGTKNPKGQEQYYSFPLFRWIRDVFAWATSPRQTVVNKAEPLLKTTLEFLFNYSTWQHKPIVPEGYSTIEGLKKYVAYGLEALTPSQYFMPKNNTMETILPFFGAWVSSGAKGGKYTTLYYKYLNEKEANNDLIDQQIDKLLAQNKITEAEKLMVSSGRYKTRHAIIDRILNYKIPIRRALMDKNYLRWLLSQGYTLDEIKEEYKKELKNANLTP